MDSIKRLFPVGRRSILFGVHNWLWHPITVWIAWSKLFGRPTWKEVVCIFIHDWGYWYCNDMDGQEGEKHPELGARLAENLFGDKYRDLVLFHSRTYAREHSIFPSKLCWADKLSIIYDPKWFYLLRARLSGELTEYRVNGSQQVGLHLPDGDWYDWYRNYIVSLVNEEVKSVEGLT